MAVAGCGGHPASTAGAQSSSRPPAAEAESSSRPSAAAAASSPTPQQAVDAWVAAGGSTDLQALAAAFHAVAHAGNDPAAIVAACQQIGPAVTKLQSDGPIQYQPAQRWLAKAIADTSKAASVCVSMPSQAATDFGAAATDLDNLSAVFQQLAG
jgi:hypothetical protein